MTRATVFLAIFLVTLNFMSIAVVQSGVGADLGIAPQPGGQAAVEGADDRGDISGVSPGNSGDDTIGIVGIAFDLFTFFDPTGGTLTDVVFSGPQMFLNLGLPSWAVDFIFAGLPIMVLADAIYLLIGRLM